MQFGKTMLLGGGPDYQGEERQKEPIATFRILLKQWEEEEVPRETASSAIEDGSGVVTDDNNLNQVNSQH